MHIGRIIGIVIAVLGLLLLIVGINASQSLGEQVLEDFTGRFSDETTWYMIGGVALIALGVLMAVFMGKRGVSPTGHV